MQRDSRATEHTAAAPAAAVPADIQTVVAAGCAIWRERGNRGMYVCAQSADARRRGYGGAPLGAARDWLRKAQP